MDPARPAAAPDLCNRCAPALCMPSYADHGAPLVNLSIWTLITCCPADFGLAVTLLIALNCISLALYQPQLPDDAGRNQALKILGGRVGCSAAGACMHGHL